tara:strand:+ start:735 stop:1259 length:525 start_codon:yes stop_codon:yes gene_type:complete
MAIIKLHARNINPKCKLALYGMAEYALSRLIPSKRLRDNLTINIHLRHHSNEGEASLDEETNRYRPRSFRVILDHHRMEMNLMTGEERTDMEWFVEILKTLAHELVHVKQYVMGELTWRDAGLLYKGIHHDPKLEEEYFELPYEVEAYGKEKGLLVGFLRVWAHIETTMGIEDE